MDPLRRCGLASNVCPDHIHYDAYAVPPRATWFKVPIYVLLSYINTIKAALTFFFYLTFSSSAEYGSLKTKFLWYAAHVGGITIFLSVFVFSPNWAIVLLIFLDVYHKICYRVCSVAYDALLFPSQMASRHDNI